MRFMIRVVGLSLLMGMAACYASHYVQEQSSGLIAISEGQLQLANGQSMPLPFANEDNPTWIFLARHAEKAYGVDAPLTEEGVKRARLLAGIFRDFPLDAIYASQYKRTQQTALPVALQKEIEIQRYDVRQLNFFAYQLWRKYRGQSVLVVGHSNTTPELANELAGFKMVERIDERDYSNFFVVAISEKGQKEVIHLKFGEIWRE